MDTTYPSTGMMLRKWGGGSFYSQPFPDLSGYVPPCGDPIFFFEKLGVCEFLGDVFVFFLRRSEIEGFFFDFLILTASASDYIFVCLWWCFFKITMSYLVSEFV